MWKPTTWKDVWPGQDWSWFGEKVHVGAVSWDGTERTAMCTMADGGVMLMPAQVLIDQAEFIGGKHS